MSPQIHIDEHTDRYLIDGVLCHNSLILKQIYQRYRHTILPFIQNNNGSLEDAKDVFQESLVIIYKMSQKNNFRLTSSFLTLLHGVCRKIWWKKLRQQKQKVQFDNIPPNFLQVNDVEQQYLAQEKYHLYREKIQALPTKQHQVLELYLEGKKMREIATITGLKSEEYAKKYKYKCKQRLLQNMSKDRRYWELVN